MKRVLITGASRGIGRAVAKTLAAAGYEVVINYRSNDAAAHGALEEITSAGGKACLLKFDVANREEAKKAIEGDIAANGAYYGVVLNAGVARDNAFPAMEFEEWNEVVRTDLDAFYNVLSPAVYPMIAARIRGRIVTVASISGVIGNRGQTNYAAAKAGLIGASKSLAIELAKRGITVNSIAPGIIETEMIAGIPDEVKMNIPMRRYGRPEEVAAVVEFLMSENAGYITRQVISVNGGMI